MKCSRIAILVAIAALCVLLAAMGQRLFRDLQSLTSAAGENLQWTILQLDTETARLHAALLEQQRLPQPNSNVVALRANIALSRIGLVQKGNARTVFSEDEAALELLDGLDEYARNIVALLDAEPEVSPNTLSELLALTRQIRPDARRLAILGNSIGARQAEARRIALAGQLRRTGLVAIAVIAALTAALIVLNRFLRIADQRDEDLRASSARLASTIAASLDAIVTTDEQGIINGFNGAAEVMFSWNAEDIIGKNIDDTLRPRPAHTTAEPNVKTWAEASCTGRIEISVRRRTGESFPAEMNVTTLGPDGDWVSVCHFRDISERKIAEMRLIFARDRAERMDRAKTRFLTIMSHEMRTPLHGILGLLDVMRSKDLTAEQDRYARVAIGSAELLLRQANDALDVTRIESDVLTLSDVEFNLSETLRDTVTLLTPLADRKGLDIDLRISPDLDILFRGDEDRIRQIATNLIGNGIKFTSTGTIKIELSGIHGQDSTDINLVVSDTGPGIPQAQQDAIFEDYVVLAEPSGRDKRGDGLGLSISRRIARLMGGDLSVKSEDKTGSTFTLSLSLRRSSPEHLPSVTRSGVDNTRNPALVPRRILVVEDNSISQSVLCEMLELMGNRVTLASDGQDGCTIAASEPFDLIIMDISMPVMDGLEATRQIRMGGGVNQATPILGLTAHGPQEFRTKAEEAGMTDFATKPLRFGKLKELLETVDRTPTEAGTVFEELVGALGAERVSEIAQKLRGEIARAIARLEHDDRPCRKSEVAEQLHKLQGAAALLGFPAVSQDLEALRKKCVGGADRAAPDEITVLTRDLKRISQKFDDRLSATQIA